MRRGSARYDRPNQVDTMDEVPNGTARERLIGRQTWATVLWRAPSVVDRLSDWTGDESSR